MGIGDEIIASGHAWSAHKRTGKRVRILDRRGKPRMHEMWAGLDFITTQNRDVTDIINGSGARPYIRYPFSRETGCTYSGWRCRDNIGVISLTDQEKLFGEAATLWLGNFVVVEPHLASTSNPNKQWGWDRWQSLVDMRPDVNWVQLGPIGTKVLRGVRHVVTPGFREAVAVLSYARTAVLPEGALHHAAGALGKCVVVLYGGAVDEDAMGYDCHLPIVDQGFGSPCGAWKPCTHCAGIWARLMPETVSARLDEALSA